MIKLIIKIEGDSIKTRFRHQGLTAREACALSFELQRLNNELIQMYAEKGTRVERHGDDK